VPEGGDRRVRSFFRHAVVGPRTRRNSAESQVNVLL
jgi:hypothetical protein